MLMAALDSYEAKYRAMTQQSRLGSSQTDAGAEAEPAAKVGGSASQEAGDSPKTDASQAVPEGMARLRAHIAGTLELSSHFLDISLPVDVDVPVASLKGVLKQLADDSESAEKETESSGTRPGWSELHTFIAEVVADGTQAEQSPKSDETPTPLPEGRAGFKGLPTPFRSQRRHSAPESRPWCHIVRKAPNDVSKAHLGEADVDQENALSHSIRDARHDAAVEPSEEAVSSQDKPDGAARISCTPDGDIKESMVGMTERLDLMHRELHDGLAILQALQASCTTNSRVAEERIANFESKCEGGFLALDEKLNARGSESATQTQQLSDGLVILRDLQTNSTSSERDSRVAEERLSNFESKLEAGFLALNETLQARASESATQTQQLLDGLVILRDLQTTSTSSERDSRVAEECFSSLESKLEGGFLALNETLKARASESDTQTQQLRDDLVILRDVQTTSASSERDNRVAEERFSNFESKFEAGFLALSETLKARANESATQTQQLLDGLVILRDLQTTLASSERDSRVAEERLSNFESRVEAGFLALNESLKAHASKDASQNLAKPCAGIEKAHAPDPADDSCEKAEQVIKLHEHHATSSMDATSSLDRGLLLDSVVTPLGVSSIEVANEAKVEDAVGINLPRGFDASASTDEPTTSGLASEAKRQEPPVVTEEIASNLEEVGRLIGLAVRSTAGPDFDDNNISEIQAAVQSASISDVLAPTEDPLEATSLPSLSPCDARRDTPDQSPRMSGDHRGSQCAAEEASMPEGEPQSSAVSSSCIASAEDPESASLSFNSDVLETPNVFTTLTGAVGSQHQLAASSDIASDALAQTESLLGASPLASPTLCDEQRHEVDLSSQMSRGHRVSEGSEAENMKSIEDQPVAEAAAPSVGRAEEGVSAGPSEQSDESERPAVATDMSIPDVDGSELRTVANSDRALDAVARTEAQVETSHPPSPSLREPRRDVLDASPRMPAVHRESPVWSGDETISKEEPQTVSIEIPEEAVATALVVGSDELERPAQANINTAENRGSELQVAAGSDADSDVTSPPTVNLHAIGSILDSRGSLGEETEPTNVRRCTPITVQFAEDAEQEGFTELIAEAATVESPEEETLHATTQNNDLSQLQRIVNPDIEFVSDASMQTEGTDLSPGILESLATLTVLCEAATKEEALKRRVDNSNDVVNDEHVEVADASVSMPSNSCSGLPPADKSCDSADVTSKADNMTGATPPPSPSGGLLPPLPAEGVRPCAIDVASHNEASQLKETTKLHAEEVEPLATGTTTLSVHTIEIDGSALAVVAETDQAIDVPAETEAIRVTPLTSPSASDAKLPSPELSSFTAESPQIPQQLPTPTPQPRPRALVIRPCPPPAGASTLASAVPRETRDSDPAPLFAVSDGAFDSSSKATEETPPPSPSRGLRRQITPEFSPWMVQSQRVSPRGEQGAYDAVPADLPTGYLQEGQQQETRHEGYSVQAGSLSPSFGRSSVRMQVQEFEQRALPRRRNLRSPFLTNMGEYEALFQERRSSVREHIETFEKYSPAGR
eukprot:TRINITY_DN14721_c0_g3_i2.p1 TRINITY_DN14721_c0_g3~~TRINITY_DN14721_c0_g3_i2.p1  ORF type:complete len:1539 (+),score=234.56 TRINITY_DN14721_c0_g3_i2:43-4659(+)